MKQTTLSDFGLEWLDAGWKPATVVRHTNRRINTDLGDKSDKVWYSSMGYNDGDKIQYSKKTGKVPMGSNPFMWEGI